MIAVLVAIVICVALFLYKRRKLKVDPALVNPSQNVLRQTFSLADNDFVAQNIPRHRSSAHEQGFQSFMTENPTYGNIESTTGQSGMTDNFVYGLTDAEQHDSTYHAPVSEKKGRDLPSLSNNFMDGTQYYADTATSARVTYDVVDDSFSFKEDTMTRNVAYGASSDLAFSRIHETSIDAKYSGEDERLQRNAAYQDLVPSDAPPAYTQHSSHLPSWFQNADPIVVNAARLAAFISIKLSKVTSEAMFTHDTPLGTYMIRRNNKRQGALVLTLKSSWSDSIRHIEVRLSHSDSLRHFFTRRMSD